VNATPAPPAAPGRIAGIDYGTVRLGIALTDARRRLASPLESYTRRRPEQDAQYLRQLVAEHEIRLFVVGLPLHLDGRESEKSVQSRQFARWLEEVTGVPVELFDERFTTVEAEQLLSAAELTRKRRRRRVDMLAAQIMLAAWLESAGRGQSPPGPLDDRGL